MIGAPTILQVKSATARYFKVPMASMTAHDRHREIAWPRQTAIYLSRTIIVRNGKPRHSWAGIGRLFDRSIWTVRDAISAVEDRKQWHEPTARAVAELTEALTAKGQG